MVKFFLFEYNFYLQRYHDLLYQILVDCPLSPTTIYLRVNQEIKYLLGLLKLGRNSRRYYNTIKPFLGKEKTNSSKNNINIKTEVNHLETDQTKVTEMMANCFTTMVDGIGVGNEEFSECRFDTQESVVSIENAMEGNSKCFQFRKVNQFEVKELLDKL